MDLFDDLPEPTQAPGKLNCEGIGSKDSSNNYFVLPLEDEDLWCRNYFTLSSKNVCQEVHPYLQYNGS